MDITLTPKQRDILVVLHRAHPSPGEAGSRGDKTSFVALEKKGLLSIDSREGRWRVSLTDLGIPVAAALAKRPKQQELPLLAPEEVIEPREPRVTPKPITGKQRPKPPQTRLDQKKDIIERAFQNAGRSNMLLDEAEAGILAMVGFYDNTQHRPEAERKTGARTRIPSKGPEQPDVSKFSARQKKALKSLKKLGLVEVDRIIRRTRKGYSRPIPGTSTVRITPTGRVFVRHFLPEQYREGTTFDVPFSQLPGPPARPRKVRPARKRKRRR